MTHHHLFFKKTTYNGRFLVKIFRKISRFFKKLANVSPINELTKFPHGSEKIPWRHSRDDVIFLDRIPTQFLTSDTIRVNGCDGLYCTRPTSLDLRRRTSMAVRGREEGRWECLRMMWLIICRPQLPLMTGITWKFLLAIRFSRCTFLYLRLQIFMRLYTLRHLIKRHFPTREGKVDMTALRTFSSFITRGIIRLSIWPFVIFSGRLIFRWIWN